MIEKYKLTEIFQDQVKKSTIVKLSGAKERIAKLNALKKYMLQHRNELHKALISDLRKPEEEIDLFEIYPIISGIKFISRRLKKWMKPKRVKTPIHLLGSKSKIVFEPKGVILIISPWNLPFQLPMA